MATRKKSGWYFVEVMHGPGHQSTSNRWFYGIRVDVKESVERWMGNFNDPVVCRFQAKSLPDWKRRQLVFDKLDVLKSLQASLERLGVTTAYQVDASTIPPRPEGRRDHCPTCRSRGYLYFKKRNKRRTCSRCQGSGLIYVTDPPPKTGVNLDLKVMQDAKVDLFVRDGFNRAFFIEEAHYEDPLWKSHLKEGWTMGHTLYMVQSKFGKWHQKLTVRGGFVYVWTFRRFGVEVALLVGKRNVKWLVDSHSHDGEDRESYERLGNLKSNLMIDVARGIWGEEKI